MAGVTPVRVRFVSDGEREVLGAFASIESRARRLANVAMADAQRRAAATTRAARAEETAAARLDKIKARSATMAGQLAKRAATDEARAAAKSAREQERSAAQVLKARERAASATEALARRQADKMISEANRAAKGEARAVAKASNARRAMAGRGAGAVGGAVGRAGRSTINTAGGIAGGLGLAAGTYAIGSALMSSIGLEERAALLANSATMPGFAPPDPAALAQTARKTAMATGTGAEDVMSAMSKVSAAGGGAKGLAAFQGDLEDVARTARSAGVAMEDMGAVYAAALNAGVQPGQEMQQLMRDLVAQGKAGSVEFSDLASELAKLGGAGRKFGSGADMLRTVSGWAQIAVESKVSPEESRTAVVDMLREMTQAPKIDAMTKLGARVAGANGKMNDPAAIMADIIAGIEGGNTFGGKGGTAYGGKGAEDKLGAYSYLFTGASSDIALNLRETFLKAGGGEAGKAAIMSRVQNAAGKSGAMTAGQRDTEYARVMNTNAAQMAVAMEQFKGEIANLLPEFTRLLPQLLQVTQGFAKLAVWLGKNPLEGVGLLFAASLTKELAVAAIPSLFKTAITAMSTASYGGTGVSPIGGGAPGQALGALGAGLAITAAAVTITAAGVQLIDKASGAGEAKGKDLVTKEIEAGNLMRRARAGGSLSDDEKRKLASTGQELSGYAQRAQWGPLGTAVEGMGAKDVLNNMAIPKFLNRLLGASGEQSQGLNNTEAQKSAEAIAKFLAEGAENAKKLAANVSAPAPTAPGAPPRNTPMSSR